MLNTELETHIKVFYAYSHMIEVIQGKCFIQIQMSSELDRKGILFNGAV